MDPQYSSIQDLPDNYLNTDEFIVVHSNEGIKAYSINLMIEHEVINDIIDHEPVIISYCALADFVGIFSRNICEETFTFGLSGYTYFEEGVWDGREAFVFWDRDTESLWFPLFKVAVSGDMINTKIESANLPYERISWGEVQQSYPNALILFNGQKMEVPSNWTKIDPTNLDCN